ncbi:hypothetical protein [Phenylobacterium sp.]|uniref:hypothetical protein n=1 Tax=Phenylobacterium sp. TaxID=1871053 RepID=UPI0030F47A8E
MSSPGKNEVELEWWGPGTVPPPASLVWCNFPDTPDLGKPGPKPRPGLVFKVAFAEDPPGDRFYILIAYGTSKLKIGKRPDDFTIANSATLDLLRLPQATRFDLDNMIWLPWARPFFCPRKMSDQFTTPMVSVLPGELQRMLGWTMARRESRGMTDAYRAAPPEPS